MGWQEGVAKAFGNIAVIYKKKGDVSEALEHYRRALELFKQLGAKREIAQTEEIIRRLTEGE